MLLVMISLLVHKYNALTQSFHFGFCSLGAVHKLEIEGQGVSQTMTEGGGFTLFKSEYG